MPDVLTHILVADLGGTHATVAIFAYRGGDLFDPVSQRTYSSRGITDFPALLQEYLEKEGSHLEPAVSKACIDFAGPVEPGRLKAFATNLAWGFTVEEIRTRTGLSEITLMNDFEAVGYGFEILMANKPEAFVRLSEAGELPRNRGSRKTAVIIGAGTGLGTSIMILDSKIGRFRPIPGEGGHADFAAVEEIEFRIAQWIRRNRNHSPLNPIDCEKVVSGPGIANIYQALWELEPGKGSRAVFDEVSMADAYDRPAIIARNAHAEDLCRRTLDIWVRCYARAAKNSAVFPLAPGGVFLAGGVAAKVLSELQTGRFMEEFTRCDVPGIRALLEHTPVFVITDYGIGLYGCASVALNPAQLD
ncbi:MAG: glucokinase [Acidobacteriia bacterium]|nr:glucokinase [Terriglobia bacterium]